MLRPPRMMVRASGGGSGRRTGERFGGAKTAGRELEGRSLVVFTEDVLCAMPAQSGVAAQRHRTWNRWCVPYGQDWQATETRSFGGVGGHAAPNWEIARRKG